MNDTSKAFTPDDLIRRSREALPQEWRSRPYNYPKLQHGVCPPQDEDTLNAYMAAYGEMHVMKLRAALQNFPYDHVLGTVEIVDWGCGQGLGSLVCLSALAQRNRGRYHVRRVSLIDPSECALQRAKNNVCEMFSSQIVTHCNYLPQANRTDCIEHLDYEAQNIIHIFSNILDVAAFDLNRLAQMVSTSGRRHFVVCVCPMNVQAKQMDIFADYFAQKNTFSNINSTYFALTSDTHYPYTCKTNCFEVTGTMAMNAAAPQKVQEWFAEPYRNDYDIQLAIDNGIITAAEAKLHEILNKQLSSDDVIFMRPDINGDQPDIAVVRRHKGILLIKIFEEDINQYELVANKEDNKQQENKKSKTVTYHLRHKDEKIECISPLDQITEFGDRLINKHIELLYAKVKDNTKNMSMVKKLVVFAKNSQQEVETFFGDRLKKYVTVAGQELLVSEEQQAKLMDTLRMIFHNIEFDDATANSFINILSPKWHAYDEGEEINLTAAQRKVVESRERARQKIRGVAGSGKTQVLVERAINAQVRTGGNILILTYNKTLINYIRYRMGRVRADFLWNKFTIKHYHGFFKEQANNAGLQCGLTSCDQAEFFENTKKPLAKYDAIFVDEVQDYEDAWLTTLHRYFLKDNGEFVVFGDPKQNVYKRNLDASGDISIRIIGGMWNKSLVKSMRCTAPLLANLSVRFQQTFFNESAEHIEWKDSQELDYNNSQLDYFNWGAPRAEDNKKVLVHEVKVAKVNEQLARACVNIIGSQTMENFVVLSDTKETLREVEFCYRKAVDRKTKTTFCTLEQYTALCKEYDYGDWRFDNDVKHIEDFRKKHFTMRSNVLHFSTIESFKGYDADTVIVIIAKEMNEKPNHNLYYTAFTRAKRSLYVFNLNEKNIYGPLFDEIKNRGIRQSSKTQTNMRTPRP